MGQYVGLDTDWDFRHKRSFQFLQALCHGPPVGAHKKGWRQSRDQREPPLWHRCAGDNWLLLRNEHKVPHAFRDPSFNRAKTLSFLGKGSKLSHARSFLAKTYYYFWGRNSSKVRLGWGHVENAHPTTQLRPHCSWRKGGSKNSLPFFARGTGNSWAQDPTAIPN